MAPLPSAPALTPTLGTPSPLSLSLPLPRCRYGPLATLLKTVGPSLQTLKLSGIILTDKICEIIAVHCRSESTSFPARPEPQGHTTGKTTANPVDDPTANAGAGSSRAASGGDPRDWDWDGGRFNYDSADARMVDTVGRSDCYL